MGRPSRLPFGPATARIQSLQNERLSEVDRAGNIVGNEADAALSLEIEPHADPGFSDVVRHRDTGAQCELVGKAVDETTCQSCLAFVFDGDQGDAGRKHRGPDAVPERDFTPQAGQAAESAATACGSAARRAWRPPGRRWWRCRSPGAGNHRPCRGVTRRGNWPNRVRWRDYGTSWIRTLPPLPDPEQGLPREGSGIGDGLVPWGVKDGSNESLTGCDRLQYPMLAHAWMAKGRF